MATVALACVYFERLCLAGVVTKPNRRLTMAACIVIAYKFNEPVLMGRTSKLAALWSFIDQEWLVRGRPRLRLIGRPTAASRRCPCRERAAPPAAEPETKAVPEALANQEPWPYRPSPALGCSKPLGAVLRSRWGSSRTRRSLRPDMSAWIRARASGFLVTEEGGDGTGADCQCRCLSSFGVAVRRISRETSGRALQEAGFRLRFLGSGPGSFAFPSPVASRWAQGEMSRGFLSLEACPLWRRLELEVGESSRVVQATFCPNLVRLPPPRLRPCPPHGVVAAISLLFF